VMSHSRSSALPRTYVGRWLRAGMLGQQELRDELVTTLNGGIDGWNDDEPAVLEAVCELMVRRYFGALPDDDEISDVARRLEEGTAQANRPVGQWQAEAVIRSGLDRSAAAAGMSRAELYLFRSYVIVFIALKLKLAASEVDELLREAERLAFERGWHPRLVPRQNSGQLRTGR
jgi:hypothetical protein